MSDEGHNYTFRGFDGAYWLHKAARESLEELKKIPKDKRSPATKILLGDNDD